jgi:hypothetical protein
VLDLAGAKASKGCCVTEYFGSPCLMNNSLSESKFLLRVLEKACKVRFRLSLIRTRVRSLSSVNQCVSGVFQSDG